MGGFMKNINHLKLGDLVNFQTGPFGTQFSASEYTKEGIPVINVKDIGFGNILTANIEHVSEQTRDRLSQHILKEEDIVFGRKGSIDRHAFITNKETGWVQGSDCIRARAKTNIDMLFLSQYLESKHVKKQLMNSAVGSTMASLNTDILKDIVVFLPDISEQHKISRVLKTLDDKILLNNQINDNLEALAKLIYMNFFFNRTPNGLLSDIIHEYPKSQVQVNEAKCSNGRFPFFTSGNGILAWDSFFVDDRNCYINTGGNVGIRFYVGKAAYSTDTWCITAKYNLADYLYLLLKAIQHEIDIKYFTGTGLKHLQKPILKERPI